MPEVDFTAALAEVTRAQTTEASVEAFINQIQTANAAAVKAAIDATTAIDQAARDAANTAAQTALDGVTAQFSAVDDKYGAAIVANTPPPPPPPPSTQARHR